MIQYYATIYWSGVCNGLQITWLHHLRLFCIQRQVGKSVFGVLRSSVHAATVWWSTREGLGVQRCSSSVGRARVLWPDAWWLLHQQSDGFGAVASTERSNCWQIDWCVASLSAHCQGRRRDLVRPLPAGWRHYRLKVSVQQTTTCAG